MSVQYPALVEVFAAKCAVRETFPVLHRWLRLNLGTLGDELQMHHPVCGAEVLHTTAPPSALRWRVEVEVEIALAAPATAKPPKATRDTEATVLTRSRTAPTSQGVF